jgi:hypothetical protein
MGEMCVNRVGFFVKGCSVLIDYSTETKFVEEIMKIGYVRVSTAEQNTMRQEVMLLDLGVEEMFIDIASEKNTDRPQ